MNSLLPLLSQSWNMLLRDRRSFGIVFLFQFFPGFVILGTVFCFYVFVDQAVLLLGSRISNIIDFIITPVGFASLIIVGLVLILGFIIIQMLCYYLSQRGLVHLFHKKRVTFRLLLSESRGVWSWIGTGLSISLYFIGFFLVCLILAILATFVHDAVVLSSVVLFVLGFIVLWVFAYFAMPSYFLDNYQYFATVKHSFSLVSGRFWKTFGYIAVILLIAIGVSLFFIFLENVAGYSLKHAPESLTDIPSLSIFMSVLYIIYAFVQLSINVFVQLFLSSYSYQVYTLYKKNTSKTLK